MNTATKNLENDHGYILRLIDVMEVITKKGAPDVRDLETIVGLIRNYADGIHHEKEEQLLFPLMAEKGFSMEQGPVAVMLIDHAEGRGYVKGVREGIELYKNGQQGAISVIFRNMQGYIDLLRSHIDKENNILFRMADNVFSETDQQNLLKEFSRVEKGGSGENVRATYIAAIEELEGIYLPGKSR